jgi:NADP-reducing hydrogenase subunit HndC
MGAGAFVCGEETALIHSNRRQARHAASPPALPRRLGLFRKPTIINNVETLANVPGLCANGPDFSRVGTEGSKGTKVFALSGKVIRTGLVEVAMGTTMRDIIFDIGGGIPDGKQLQGRADRRPLRRLHPRAASRHPDRLRLAAQGVGAMMGSGGLVVMDEDTCMVDVAKFFMDFIQRRAAASASPAARARAGCSRSSRRSPRPEERRERPRRAAALPRRHGTRDNSPTSSGHEPLRPRPDRAQPGARTLRWFRNEYEAHIFERSCPPHAARSC